MTGFHHLHAEDSLSVAFQRAQQQAALGVAHADGAVVRSDEEQPPGALLSGAQTAHPAGAVALKHIQLLQSLMKTWLEKA